MMGKIMKYSTDEMAPDAVTGLLHAGPGPGNGC
jgi:hypothetical protein